MISAIERAVANVGPEPYYSARRGDHLPRRLPRRAAEARGPV